MDHVVYGAGRRGKVKDVIDFAAVDLAVEIELQELELALTTKMFNVREASCKQVVQRDDGVAVSQQSFAKMRAKETGTARNQRAWPHNVAFFLAGRSSLTNG